MKEKIETGLNAAIIVISLMLAAIYAANGVFTVAVCFGFIALLNIAAFFLRKSVKDSRRPPS